eukprot:TRINITY_DN1251_c0_g1_i3.p1 TRINITY_DN1251_c0_g1~~TRINITY_DN1251_c0_g1_i3.p1  ORF type:complete len:211 (+),score=61.96 TRINITY_DN1251_c0_g1_i3:100-732(+)
MLSLFNCMYHFVIYPFFAMNSQYLIDYMDYDQTDANMMTSIFGAVCFLSPIIGYTIDRFGYGGILLSVAGIIQAIVYALYFYTGVPIWLCITFFGLCFSFVSPALVSIVPLLLEESLTNIGFTIYFASQNLGFALGSIIAGKMVDLYNWQSVFILWICTSAFCGILALICNLFDPRINHTEIEHSKEKLNIENNEDQEETIDQITEPLLI